MKLHALEWEIACPYCNYTIKGCWNQRSRPYQVIVDMISQIGKPCPACKTLQDSARKWTK